MCQMRTTGYYSKVMRMAGPVAFSRFVNMLSGVVGLMFAAHLGRDVLAATALLNVSGAFIFLLGMSILFSIGVVVAQLYGKGQEKEIGALFQQSLLLAVVICIPSMYLYWNIDHILLFAGQSPHLVHYLRRYFHTLMWGSIATFLLVVMQQLFYALNKQRVVMISNALCFIPFTCLAYAIILGRWGMPEMGLKGLALAFIFLNVLNSVVLVVYAYCDPALKKYALFGKHNWQGLIFIRQLFRVGWPMAVQFGGEFFIFFIIMMMIGWLGDTSLSAFQIVLQWQQLVIVPIFGVSEAIGILIGHAVGAKQYKDLSPLLASTILIVVALSVLVAFLYISLYHYLAGFYINPNLSQNVALLHLIRVLFIFAAISRLFDNLRIVLAGALRGLHDTQFAMWSSLLLLAFVGLPLGYFFAIKLHFGVQGFILANGLVFLLNAVLLYMRWLKQHRLLPC